MHYSEAFAAHLCEVIDLRRHHRARQTGGREKVSRSQHLLTHVAKLGEPGGRFAGVARYQLKRQAEGIVQADRAAAELARTEPPFATEWVCP